MAVHFADRVDAGRKLARKLDEFKAVPGLLVLGLPRGGVPVAFTVAHALNAALDVLIVRKIGAPGQAEFAVGAIASGGVTVMNDEVPPALLASPEVEATIRHERQELKRREELYRAARGSLELRDRTVVLVDDGAATGSSMLAAVRAARQLGAREIVVALPVASVEAADKLALEADRVVCISTPTSFAAVGYWYDEFSQTTDEEVRDLLARATA